MDDIISRYFDSPDNIDWFASKNSRSVWLCFSRS